MYKQIQISTQIKLDASSVYETAAHVDQKIYKKVVTAFGDRCNTDGYILGSTIEVLNRSHGIVGDVVVNGGVVYDVLFNATAFNPSKGVELVCRVISHNFKCVSLSMTNAPDIPINIFMPIDWHALEIQQNIKNGIDNHEYMRVSVLGTRLKPNGRDITVIVEFVEFVDDVDTSQKHPCLVDQ